MSAHLVHRAWLERHRSFSAAPVASNAIDLSTIAGSLAATGVTGENISPFTPSIPSVEPSSTNVFTIFGLPAAPAVAPFAVGLGMKSSGKICLTGTVDGHLSNIRRGWSPITTSNQSSTTVSNTRKEAPKPVGSNWDKHISKQLAMKKASGCF